MDEMAAWPSVRAYKDHTLALLRDVAPTVDVGCGVGNDARALGAIGIDPSLTMVTEARRRGGAYARGDVLALPFASGSLGGLRTDRVLQHVPDPADALAEIARVLRVGGVAVLAEPDQGTLRIDGTNPELTPAIVRFRVGSINNARLGGELADRLAAVGFTEVGHESFPIELRDHTLAFGLPTWPSMLVARGEWTEEDARQFTDSIGPDFLYRFDVVVTWGRR
jgi:SAM-dependent methyltransferase